MRILRIVLLILILSRIISTDYSNLDLGQGVNALKNIGKPLRILGNAFMQRSKKIWGI